jgi:lambda family phage portal protein
MGFRPEIHSSLGQKRAYSAGQINRLTGDWGTSLGSFSRSIDAETRYTLRIMRGRSREQYQNNDYYKKFVRLVVKNVVGPNGMAFKNAAKDSSGSLDTQANAVIKERFLSWGKKGTCDVTGKLSWGDCQRLFIQTVATDGEVLVRKVRNFKNPFKFAIQFLEADHLDENYNTDLPNGNQIRMSVEFDQWDRPVAYHLLTQHPGDYSYNVGSSRYERIPAADIIHAFISERPRQTRGVPWGHTAMTRLNNLGGYEEAAIISKRTSAAKMGFLIPPTDGEGGYEGDGTEGDDLISEIEPGMLEQLPAGYTFAQFNPSEPGGDYEPFMKRTLKGIASGLDISYIKLASDLEGVSYSSIRQGELDDRDTWMTLQAWMAETFNDNIYIDFLDIQLMAGLLITQTGAKLPYAKFDKFCAACWRPRRWAWVDPLKDILAKIRALEFGLTNHVQIAEEQGEDFYEDLEQMKEVKKLVEAAGFQVAMTFNGGVKNAGTIEGAGVGQ